MQRSPPAYYLAFNIFMWGALLMCQAAVKNLQSLLALRILSGAFEAIADPAFMLITSMYYTRAEQPSRISAWYAFNGVGVAGGGLIGKFAMLSPLAYFTRIGKCPLDQLLLFISGQSVLMFVFFELQDTASVK